ncbi:MAG TPA: GNAT family protein [Vicinamibacterales bacterium]|nr:GNAT family protein [Vicinamibacterales bacterium]
MPASRAPESIETGRLRLRRPQADDAAAIFARYSGDPQVTHLVGWPRHTSVDEARAFVQFSDAEWARSPSGPLLIEPRGGGALLGATGLVFETSFRAQTGYVLATDAWGRGYATEALGAIVDLARTLGVRRLYALCHHEHRASARVLEKCAFSLEGRLRAYAEFPNLTPGEPQDVLCYARLL